MITWTRVLCWLGIHPNSEVYWVTRMGLGIGKCFKCGREWQRGEA